MNTDFIKLKADMEEIMNDFNICEKYFPIIITPGAVVMNKVLDRVKKLLLDNQYVNERDESLINDSLENKRIIGFVLSRYLFTIYSAYFNKDNSEYPIQIETSNSKGYSNDDEILSDIKNIIEEEVVLVNNLYRIDLSSFDEIGFSPTKIGLIKDRS